MSTQRFLTFCLHGILTANIGGYAFGQNQPPPVQPPARTDPVQAVPEATRNFVRDALRSGRKEIATADLAGAQGSDQAVKALAKTIVDDYTKTNTTLEDLARKKMIQTDIAADIDLGLASLKGPSFDREFIKEMIADHTLIIEKFQLAEKQITDPELHEFIVSTLPLLQTHLDRAKALVQSPPDKLSDK